jgi:predicted dithiol-disulfide oxidoreductase (DUF899 family)
MEHRVVFFVWQRFQLRFSLHPKVAPAEYNSRNKEEMSPVLLEGRGTRPKRRLPPDDPIFHTYSTYARGTESLTGTYRLLDFTLYGRQQAFEDSPAGCPAVASIHDGEGVKPPANNLRPFPRRRK